MSQQSVAYELEKHYPDYLTKEDLMIILGTTKSSVCHNLRALAKREEVEYEMTWKSKFSSKFGKAYRIKPEIKNGK